MNTFCCKQVIKLVTARIITSLKSFFVTSSSLFIYLLFFFFLMHKLDTDSVSNYAFSDSRF